MRVKAFLDNAYRLIFARDVATSQPIFYVSPSGSDSNNGLTVGTAFLTIQKAIDTIAAIDCNGFDPQIILAAGTYVQPGTGLILKNCVGVGTKVAIVGDPNNRTAYKIQAQNAGNRYGIYHASSTYYELVGLEIGVNNSVSTNHKLLYVIGTSIGLNNCCFRGAVLGQTDGIVLNNALVTLSNTLRVEGAWRWVFDCNDSEVFFDFANFTNINSSGGASYNVFLNGVLTTVIVFNITHTGTFTGKRFELIVGYVQTYGFGAGLPGNSAGTISYPTS